MKRMSFFHANISLTALAAEECAGLRPYGQPGQMPSGNFAIIDCVKSASFISWFLYNHFVFTSTCELVNKSSKSIIFAI